MKNNTLALLTLIQQETKRHDINTELLMKHYDDKKERDITEARTTAFEHIDNMIAELRQVQIDIGKLPYNTLIVKYPILQELED